MKSKLILCLALVSVGLLLLYVLSFGPVLRLYGVNERTGGAGLPLWVRTFYLPLWKTPEPLAGILNLYCERWMDNSIKADKKNSDLFDFPVLPPISNADPSIQSPISVRVPTKLKINQVADRLYVDLDTNSFESTNLFVGTNMVIGNTVFLDFYPAGKPPVTKSGNGSEGGGTEFSVTRIFEMKQDGSPSSDGKYVVEAELIIFETDIPPQHMWGPSGSKNYRVLWQRILKQTVE